MGNPIKIFMGDVTAGGTDGVEVSAGNFYSPIHFDIDARNDEEQIQILAVRCENYFRSSGEVTISDYNDTADRYQLSLDGENFSDSITLPQVENVNIIFYAKSRTTSVDRSYLDRGARFVIDCDIERA